MFWGFGMIDSPPIIQGLHLDPTKNTKHTSVPLHNLQILNVTIYNHCWTWPVARVHRGSITFENIGRGCTHENSACSLFVDTSHSEHTVTSTVLMWIHIIMQEGKQIQPQNRTVMPPKIVGDLRLQSHFFWNTMGVLTWQLFVAYLVSFYWLNIQSEQSIVYWRNDSFSMTDLNIQ